MSLAEFFTSNLDPGGRPECIIASNRGPIEYHVEDGIYKRRLGSGGLVTALLGATRHRRVVWIAFTMTEADRLGVQADLSPSDPPPPALAGTTLRLFSIPEQVYQKYYYNISNHVLWFAQHSLLDPVMSTTFTQQTQKDWEEGYRVANEAIANAVIDELKTWGPETPVIFQDYQLYLAPGLVRARYPEARLGHVIYIPWPDARYLAMLPDYMVQAIYCSMAANDMLGFQTLSDARNFLAGAARFLDGAQVDYDAGVPNEDLLAAGLSDARRPSVVAPLPCENLLAAGLSDARRPSVVAPLPFKVGTLLWQGRRVQICLYPAVLSPQYLHAIVQSQEAGEEARALQAQVSGGNEEQLLVRVDRIEPTKNIVRGFQAYERLLQTHPELRGRVTFLALLVPSRDSLADYRLYEHAVQEIITRINTQYGRDGWLPVVALFGNNRVRALVGLQNYDVLLVNPVIDGMNLVVKEGALLNKRSGVIILSRTVGAHDTIGDHVLSITPLDIDATADALYSALTMSSEERACRAGRVRTLLLREDAARWFDMQIDALCSASYRLAESVG